MSVYPLCDTHCHLNLYENSGSLIREVADQGIHVSLMTTTPDEYADCLKLAEGKPTIHPCIGLHPIEITAYADKVGLFMDILAHTRWVGEIGLDYVTQDEEERELQRSIFRQILSACADHGDRILSIHSRRSAEDVIKAVGPDFPGTVILHWFSGSDEALASAAPATYFSINTAMIKSKRWKTMIHRIPRDRVLTETDGPFIQFDHRPAVPADVIAVINSLAHHWQCSVKEAADQVFANYQRAIA